MEVLVDVEHWHGADPKSWFAHITISYNPLENQVTWLAPVKDEEYHSATDEAEKRSNVVEVNF